MLKNGLRKGLLCKPSFRLKNKEITEDQVEVLFKKDRALFKEKAGEIISYKTTEQIKKDFDKHPVFDEWIKKLELKSKELVKKIPIKKEAYKITLKMYDNAYIT